MCKNLLGPFFNDLQKPMDVFSRIIRNAVIVLVRRPIHKLKMSQCLSAARGAHPMGFKNQPPVTLVTKILKWLA